MGSINARVEQVVTYDPDPRGLAMFGALVRVGRRALNGREGMLLVGDRGRPETSFNGYTTNPQAPTKGLAPLGQNLGAGTPTKAATTELPDAGGLAALSNPAVMVFAQRLKRAGQ